MPCARCDRGYTTEDASHGKECSLRKLSLGESFDELTYAEKVGRHDLFIRTGITALPFAQYVESLYRPRRAREERMVGIDEHTASVMEARSYVKEGMSKGTTCPCCKQKVKTTKIELTAKQAVILGALYQYFPEGTVLDIGEFVRSFSESMLKGALLQGKEWSKLHYWGFLSVVPVTKEITAEYKKLYSHVTKKPSLHCVTPRVASFVTGAPAMKRLFILNREVQGWDDEQVTFAELFEKERDRYAAITAVATGHITLETREGT